MASCHGASISLIPLPIFDAFSHFLPHLESPWVTYTVHLYLLSDSSLLAPNNPSLMTPCSSECFALPHCSISNFSGGQIIGHGWRGAGSAPCPVLQTSVWHLCSNRLTSCPLVLHEKNLGSTFLVTCFYPLSLQHSISSTSKRSVLYSHFTHQNPSSKHSCPKEDWLFPQPAALIFLISYQKPLPWDWIILLRPLCPPHLSPPALPTPHRPALIS